MPLLFVAGNRYHPDDVQPNVIVPYVTPQGTPWIIDAVKLNLSIQGLRPRMVKLERTYAYDQLFRELWDKGSPFILVEHDILPWPGALAQLWTCPEPWCGFQYFVYGELRSYLGCTKFDPTRLGPCPLPADDLVGWDTLDKAIEKELTKRKAPWHLHEPAVTHLNFFHSRMTDKTNVHPQFWEG